ncbi:hypothetical protein V6Z11_D11G372800 [Gossypium hirsutum]
MSSTEEGGGAVGAVSTDQTIINNNTNNDYVRIDMRFTDVHLSDGEVANLRLLPCRTRRLDRSKLKLFYRQFGFTSRLRILTLRHCQVRESRRNEHRLFDMM